MEQRAIKAETRDMLIARLIEVLGYLCAVGVIAGLLGAGVYIAVVTESTYEKIYGGALTVAGLVAVARVFIRGKSAPKSN